MDIETICIKCGQDRDKGRKMCRSYYLEYKRNLQKEKYYTIGRYMYSLICEACHKPFKGFKKQEKLCDSCWKLQKELAAQFKSTNKYIYHGKSCGRSTNQHRYIAEKILNRKLQTNEVVHHMDHNPKNNEIINLIIMDRRSHRKLHAYLDQKRVIFEKSENENSENCWNNLILPLTTTWLEITGVKVIKLWEVGQSAAEPLLNEEGSETMYGTPKSNGDDIVQTTTLSATATGM